MVNTLTKLDRIRGCFLGGAVGDALGAPVEFLELEEIRSLYGREGVKKMESVYGRVGAITDDTQMTLFTAEGLIQAYVCNFTTAIYQAYLHWLHTQGIPWEVAGTPRPDQYGWLVTNEVLHSRRSPGNSCMSALLSGKMGTIESPINNSKGCGGVMRVAPVGFCADNPFILGAKCAAITHGHPTGYLAAGAFALIVNRIFHGDSLVDASEITLAELQRHPNHEETSRAIKRAMALACSTTPSPGVIEELGQGWVAEEALAISLYCAITAQDFPSALRTAVNHSGDSDSTGSMTGNLLGCYMGKSVIPEGWLICLEGKEIIEKLADSFHRRLQGG